MVIKRILKNSLVEELADHPSLQILELGIGDGELLAELYDALTQSQVVAMDMNRSLLSHCQFHLPGDRITFVPQDLSLPWSAGYEARFDAVYFLQSIHDFGGREALILTYSEAARVLKPGGILLNADFIGPMSHDDPAAQRRFPADVHIEIMNTCGFESADLLQQEGLLGCMMGILPI